MSKYSFKSVGFTKESRKYNIKSEKRVPPIGIKTPLELSDSGLFSMHFSVADQIKDNLKNLILTNKGERLGRFNFGADVRSLATELSSIPEFESEAMLRIKRSVGRYMPSVDLKTFETRISETPPDAMAKIIITIVYDVPRASLFSQRLDLNIYAAG